MQQIILHIAFLTLALCAPVDEHLQRKVIPSEADPHRIQSFLWQDEQGVVHNESLIGVVPRLHYDMKIVKLNLYTKANPIHPERIDPFDMTTLTKSNVFNPKVENIFVIHGWNNDGSSNVNTLIREAVLAKKDVNFFVLDWGKVSWRNYLTARYATSSIGAAFGFFLNDFVYEFNIKSQHLTLIGHSLGAHLAGVAGSTMDQKPGRIVGLDPAGPLFSLSNTKDRLDVTDADYVQIIHTSGGKLALRSSLGHADYFPNGGEGKQPGCGLDLFGTCAHSRSYQYYAESIKSCDFKAIQCTSFKDYVRGNCKGNYVSKMGCFDTDNRVTGDFYLRTNSKEPFAQILSTSIFIKGATKLNDRVVS